MTEPARHIAALVASIFGLALLAGCSSAGSEQKTGLLNVSVPLRKPTWVPEKKALLAVSEDRRRVVRVDVGETAVSPRRARRCPR